MTKRYYVNDCLIVPIKTINDIRGNLGVIEYCQNIPFVPRRFYFIYGVPSITTRGAHAHRELMQVIVAIQGSVDVQLYDGVKLANYTLKDPSQGLYIAPGIWREILFTCSDTICLVAASKEYDESDYIRDMDLFETMVNNT